MSSLAQAADQAVRTSAATRPPRIFPLILATGQPVMAMGGYLASFSGINDPDAQWVAVLSVIPFFR